MSGPWFRKRWLMIYPVRIWGWLAYAAFFALAIGSVVVSESPATPWASSIALSIAFAAMLLLGLTLILKTEKR